jgi:hypothetical protein
MEMEEIARPPNLWVEHILPQSWQGHWPLPGGGELPLYSADPLVADQIRDRDRLKNTLGNLTLLTSEKNKELGNQDFNAKKGKLEGHTLLALNHSILKKDQWTEKEIGERGRLLTKYAIGTWPHANSIG